MNRINIYNEDKDDGYSIEIKVQGKVKQLNRKCSDDVGRVIERLLATIFKSEKKTKNKKMKILDSIDLEKIKNEAKMLDKSDNEIPFAMASLDAWKQASVLSLNDITYQVFYNSPKVSSLRVGTRPMVGMPLYPLVQFQNAALKHSKFTWYRRKFFQSEPMECEENAKDTTWIKVSDDIVYVPSEKDEGFHLKVVCQPGSQELPCTGGDNDEIAQVKSAETQHEVTNTVDKCLYEYAPNLQQFLATKNDIRVVSYNILADCYANTEQAQNELFAYCPEKYRSMDYRISLILKELKAYDGDIVMLQEVDRSIFEQVLIPVMSIEGYGAAMASKLRCSEGVAIFFKRSMFKLVQAENCVFSESLENDETMEVLKKDLKANPTLWEKVKNRGSCGLLCMLQHRDDDSKLLALANTHLFFHPRAPNVRLVQMQVLLKRLQFKIEEMMEAHSLNKSQVSYMLCGDLNSFPTSGTCQLITSGKLPSNHTDWYSGGKSELPKHGIGLEHSLNLTNVLGSRLYTNYAAGFYAHLDHMYISSHTLNVSKVLELPLHEKVVEHTALPSKISPSDHIAQVVDLNII